jgi:hypothetical protein
MDRKAARDGLHEARNSRMAFEVRCCAAGTISAGCDDSIYGHVFYFSFDGFYDIINSLITYLGRGVGPYE